jgi:serine protease Do
MEPEVTEYSNQKIFRESKALFFFLAIAGGIFGSFLWEHRGTFTPASLKEEAPKEEASHEIALEDRSLTSLVNENSPGVVSIVIKKPLTQVQSGFPFFFLQPAPQQNTSEPQKVGSGSGFFATKDGIIVTNKHVVADESAEYFVYRVGDDTEYKAEVIARDPVNDIAFLKIEGKDFPALKLGDSDVLQVGETAIAIGNSLGEFANSVSRGIVSGKQRSLTAGNQFGEAETLAGVIQTDAAINPGNSGGPLFNLKGEVIGVNVAVAQGAENIGFALPINQVKIRLEQVQKTGKIEVPYLGVRYVLVNDALKKEMALPYSYGALVLRGREITDFAVIPGSPAAKAGILENDVLLTIQGEKITSESTVAEVLIQHQIGDTISLTLWRAGEEKTVSLTLEKRP